MPAAAMPSICRRRSHLVPRRKRVPASFSFQLPHRGLDAFQLFQKETAGKVSLGSRRQPPGEGQALLGDRPRAPRGQSHGQGMDFDEEKQQQRGDPV